MSIANGVLVVVAMVVAVLLLLVTMVLLTIRIATLVRLTLPAILVEHLAIWRTSVRTGLMEVQSVSIVVVLVTKRESAGRQVEGNTDPFLIKIYYCPLM